MAGSESPIALIQNQLAIQAQMLLSDHVQRHCIRHLYDDQAQVLTTPTMSSNPDVAIWRRNSTAPPVFVLEVREQSERWLIRLERMVEYLRIGVRAVVILDPKTESASVFRSGARPLRKIRR
jgi:hypothetical protein